MSSVNVEFSRHLLWCVRQELTPEQKRRLRKCYTVRHDRDYFEFATTAQHDNGHSFITYVSACNAFEAKAKGILRWLKKYYDISLAA